MSNPFVYLSLGAGVQSTALLVMSCEGLCGCPRADAAVFADTQDEPAWVYQHLEWCRAFAAKRGMPVEIVTNGKLSGDLVRRSMVPFFTGQSGMLLRKCTNDFKLRPIRRWVRERVGLAKGERARGVKAHALIGISVDEATEALRKEVADLRARIEAAHAAWAVDSDAEALLSSDVDMVLLEPADIDRLTRALDLTREWGGA